MGSAFTLGSEMIVTRGAAAPFIKFFKQNGCIVIHKCEHSIRYARHTSAHTTVFGGITEVLNPRCVYQALQLDMQRQVQPHTVFPSSPQFFTYCLIQAAERMGADILSIDGFECGLLPPDFVVPGTELVGMRMRSVGAGHPGEEDIGGLVLVCWHNTITSWGSVLTIGSLNVHRRNSKSHTLLREDLLMDKDWYPRWRLVLRWVPLAYHIPGWTF